MKTHFIGIGGIGVSALARYYKSIGAEVSGSDLVASEIIDELKAEGLPIFIGPHSDEHIKKDIDLVVFSAAINKENVEFKKAKELGIKTAKYSDALGEIAEDYYLICIAGTHGKSTTTSMLSLILIEAGMDPTVIVGTKLKEFGNTNFHAGSSKPQKGFSKPLMLIEADEWSASFLSYKPDIIAITNIEEDHLDYYNDLDHIIKTFNLFIGQMKDGGILILSKEDSGSQTLFNELSGDDLKIHFCDEGEGIPEKEIKKALKVPGKHNLKNALVANSVAKALSVSDEDILSGLNSYEGVWRRFDERKLKINGKEIIIINDYAHHPTEIMATLEAAREKYPDKTIWTVFQPHQQQRTKFFIDKFAKAFDLTDNLILTNIYEVAGREKEEVTITSQDLTNKIKERWQDKGLSDKGLEEVSDFNKIAEIIKEKTENGDVVLLMGAGDIWGINKNLFPQA